MKKKEFEKLAKAELVELAIKEASKEDALLSENFGELTNAKMRDEILALGTLEFDKEPDTKEQVRPVKKVVTDESLIEDIDELCENFGKLIVEKQGQGKAYQHLMMWRNKLTAMNMHYKLMFPKKK